MEHQTGLSIAVIIVFVMANLLILIVAIPLKKGMVPPNSYYGFRTAKTLSSEDIWYKANERAGSHLIKAGVISIVATLSLLFFASRFSPLTLTLILSAIMTLFIGGAIIISALYLRTL
ncbi:MAG: SdpI family protein [Syntrophales bacterium]|nr:SdpI family protein [Syntrophales bacterium]